MAVVVTNENFNQEIKNETKPIIIDIYASWCGPCQHMAPIFAELEEEIGSTYKFAKINVDESRDLSIQYGVTSVPTFIFVQNNEVVGRTGGYMSKEDLKAKIQKAFGA
ncbi:thioredoxin [Candidatus Babeliales bacterium]|nr:thioredoxin [Candidatus Babeliales bacterium]